MTYEDMIEKTNAQLVEVHNELAACLEGVEPLKQWKQAKDKLIDRIVPLQERVAEIEEAEAEAEAEAEPKRTIKAASVDLLCHVAYYENRDEKPADDNRVEEDDPKARSVGLAYDEIIARIQDEFPGCNTSVACLRWYSVKIRVEEHGYEGLKLPQRRPRAKPKTAA